MLDISWSSPYAVREGFATKWRREWYIPPKMLGGFFAFWKAKRFKMLADGFTVTKSEKTGKWYLYETKENVALFNVFGNDPLPYKKYNDKFELPPHSIIKTDGLRPWQVGAAGKLVSSIKHWGAAIDGSELGTGKTFSACGVVRDLKVPFIIVCPKPVMNQWKKVVTNHFHIENNMKGIINYELLIRGRKDSSIASFILHRHAKRATLEWKLPKDTIIIWDEAHRLKNFKTKASKTCMLAHKQGYKQLFLSASIAVSPLDLRTIGTCTGLFKTADEYYTWAYAHGVYKGKWGLEFNNDSKTLQQIHKYLFEQRGVRLQRDVIPNFPETEIIVNAYNMAEEDTLKIKEIYTEMRKELNDLKSRSTGDSEMAIRIRALQKTELIKVPLMEEMIREGMDVGMSTVVFLNYSDSVDALAARLNTTCIYDGRNEKMRGKNVELFQSNHEPVLVTNIAAAKEGLNLGDETGGHPRLAILSPTYSVLKLKQALGRVHRENSKTKSIQKILYVAGTQEEDVVDSMGQKLENLTLINNGVITDEDLKIG